MDTAFRSILKDEIESFIEFIKLDCQSITVRAYRRTLSGFDSFLQMERFSEKRLDAHYVKLWLDGFHIHNLTKQGKLSHLRRFARYLSTLGIPASLPELPRETTSFMPYIFNDDEMVRIFEAVDDLILGSPTSKRAAELPILIRMLYGCGFRLGEAISLTWNDVDLSTGVVTVRAAKNQKQRIVPMCDELTRILKLYREAPCFEMNDDGLLFGNSIGQPRNNRSYWHIFDGILCDLGIKNPETAKYGSRGPCIHSLRHTFTLNSLLKSESEGRGFMESVPFLSTYLGHAGLMETDKYLKARHEMYIEAHKMIEDYTHDVFPEDVFPEDM